MRPALDVEVPRALRKRPRDRRGYPIPWIVMVDKAKRPHFTVNDGARVLACGRKRLCGLCGEKLRGDIAFVGGPICFLSVTGAFSDPPMHRDCAAYAIRVCPYLAAPSYARRIEDKTVRPEALPDGMFIGKDEMVADDRPVAFMLGRASGSEMIIRSDGAPLFRATGEWITLELWQRGRELIGDEHEEALWLDRQRWPPGAY